MFVNFGDETFEMLTKHGYTRDNIDWIGNNFFQIEEGWFWTLADNSNYDAGYGRPEMPGDIIIMMDDGTWFKRHEYDGSEWWIHVAPPKKPMTFRHVANDSFVWHNRFEPNGWASSLAEFCE